MKTLILTMLAVGLMAPLNAMQKEDYSRDFLKAVEAGDEVHALDLLRTKNINPNEHIEGSSLLHHAVMAAVQQNRTDIVQALLNAGARVNGIDFGLTGDNVAPLTVLDLAVGAFYQPGQPLSNLASILVEHGAKRAGELPREEIQRAFNAYNAASGGHLHLITAAQMFGSMHHIQG